MVWFRYIERELSTMPISPTPRLIIYPTGVVSKKERGLLRSTFMKSLLRLKDARPVPQLNNNALKNANKYKETKRKIEIIVN